MKSNQLQASAQPKASDVANAVKAIFRQQKKMAAKPATDDQLSRIWPPWNALPDDMLPEEKCWILSLNVNSGHDRSSAQFAPLKMLLRKFKYLPLDPNEYRQALNLACRWETLIKFVQSTQHLHKDLMAGQWAFADADKQAAGRVAISRAAKEIKLIHPGLLKSKNPTIQRIETLETTYAAYSDARAQALAALSKLIYKLPEMRTGKTLPPDEVALGVPNPPNDVPRYLYIARLDALGICSKARLNDFLRDELPNLKRSRRMKFDRVRRKPKYGKNPYAGFMVWVLDNRPIFENAASGWQWKDILRAAEEKQIECPKTQTGLKQWAYRSKVQLTVKIGQPFSAAKGIKRSSPLLSPAPVFGDVLKATAS